MIKNDLTIENAKLILRNFSGKATDYTPAGKRSFHVLLTEEAALALARDGWNVKKKERPGEDPMYRLEVAVSYENRPPSIFLLTSGNTTLLTESTVGELDTAEIEVADLVIHPFNWEMNGKTGTKAYVKSLYVTVAEDALARKYRERLHNDGN